jgi:hypothetical protein
MRPKARAILAAAPDPGAAATLTTAQLRALLRKAGRSRGIDTEAARLRLTFPAPQMRQLPLVEQAIGRQALALLRQLNAACQAAADLEQAAIESLTCTRTPGSLPASQGSACSPAPECLPRSATTDPGSRMPRGSRPTPGQRPSPGPAARSPPCCTAGSNQRLAAVGYIWAFSALNASPGARARYDRRKADGDRHAAAQRNLLGLLLGCLHHCLATGQHYDESTAFPKPAPATHDIAA